MSSKIKRFLILSIGLLVLGGAAFYLLPKKLPSFQPRAGTTVEEIVVQPRTVTFGVEATGALRAASMQNIAPPADLGNYWELQIVSMAPEGKDVKPGENLVTLAVPKIAEDLQVAQTEAQQAAKELEKAQSQAKVEQQDLETKLATAQNNYDKFKLKQSSTTVQVSLAKDLEIDRLELEQARREVVALTENLEWQRKASEANVGLIASKKSLAENTVQKLLASMNSLQLKADRSGIVIYKQRWNNEKLKVGDTIWRGQTILGIPDLNTLVLDVYVPEVDVSKIKLGQPVEITIDALQGKTYMGKVTQVGTLIHPKSYDIPNKVLDVQINFDELDVAVMRPAMSVKAKIETGTRERSMTLPLTAIRTTAAGSLVKRKTEQGWAEIPVKLGETVGAEVVIAEGLNPGDHIAADFGKAK